MLQKIEQKKIITVFSYNEIDSNTIDDLIQFIKAIPKSETPRYTNGTDVLLDSLNINLIDNKPATISVLINYGGKVKSALLRPGLFYFFDKTELIESKQIE